MNCYSMFFLTDIVLELDGVKSTTNIQTDGFNITCTATVSIGQIDYTRFEWNISSDEASLKTFIESNSLVVHKNNFGDVIISYSKIYKPKDGSENISCTVKDKMYDTNQIIYKLFTFGKSFYDFNVYITFIS